MRARATIFGQPIHRSLVRIPLGLFVTAIVFDFIARFAPSDELSIASYWMIIAGLVGGVAAALFGFIDWSAIPRGTRARRVGSIHAVNNVLLLLAFAFVWLLRFDNPAYQPSIIVLAVEVGAFVLAGIGAWLGGQLVDHYGIGVHEGAHPDLRPDEARAARRVADHRRREAVIVRDRLDGERGFVVR